MFFSEQVRRFLTVHVLYPFDVIFMQREIVSVNPLVEGSHYGAGVVRVLQTEGVAELVDGNQEEVDTCQSHSGPRSARILYHFQTFVQINVRKKRGMIP